jgi:lipoprotein-anchoring transpeptidase ErfK/SrfK
MRKRALTFTAFALVVLIGGAVAAYSYDTGRENTIARGVTVAGVDVGGMNRDSAVRLLQRRLAEPLAQPIVVRAGRHRFELSAQRAQVTTDVMGMVSEAITASRRGDIVQRTWRELTGGRVHEAVPLHMSYSSAAVRSMVATVKQAVNRKPRDATIAAGTSGLKKVASRSGVALQSSDLARALRRALRTPAADRSIVARTRILEPRVSTDQLADKYPVYVVVNRPGFTLSVYEHLRLKKSYRVAVGRIGLETPAGLYHVQDKQMNPSWHVPNSPWAGKLAGKVIPPGPDDPLKARWLGIFNGAGIHGTDALSSLGTAASHGCIRMAIPDVIEVYDTVPVGAPVYIA